MIVYLVEATRGGLREQGFYIVGIFSQYEDAVSAKQKHEYECGGRYICDITALDTDAIRFRELEEVADPEPSLQEQVEALQAYVGVLQRHILCLTDAVASILHIPDIKKGVGENGARNLLKHLAEGRRTTWEER